MAGFDRVAATWAFFYKGFAGLAVTICVDVFCNDADDRASTLA